MASSKSSKEITLTGHPLVAQTWEWAKNLQKDQKDYAKGVSMSSSMHYGEQAKYVHWTFPDSLSHLELIHITDVQFGHIACKVDRFEEYLDWILDSPCRYILGGGDWVDAWALWSPGSPFEQNANPQSQCYRFAERMSRVRHRILGSVGGNHERRAIPAFGDLGTLLASYLQIPYSSGQQFIDIKFGKHQPFKIHLWHGRGTSRTKGAKMNMLHEMMKRSDAQLCLVGHLHDVLVTFDWQLKRDNGKVKLVKQGGAMSSSFMEFWGTYGEVGGMNPSDVMMARTVLEPSGRWELTLK